MIVSTQARAHAPLPALVPPSTCRFSAESFKLSHLARVGCVSARSARKNDCCQHEETGRQRGGGLTENDAAVGFVYPSGHLVITSCTFAPSRARIFIAPILRTLLPFLFLCLCLSLPLLFRMTLLHLTALTFLLFVFSIARRRGRSTKYPAIRHERAPSLFSPFRARFSGTLRSDEHPVLLVQAIAVLQRWVERGEMGARCCA